jgi:hypothetical protein
LQKPTINLRLAVLCMAAASVGLSMAIVSIARLLLVVCGQGKARRQEHASIYYALIGDCFCVVLGRLLAFGSPRVAGANRHRMPA